MLKKAAVVNAISEYQPKTSAATPITAAVLVLFIYDQEENCFIIITKRPDTIATYAGDYCLPGGMFEAIDVDLKVTVQREVTEELSITPEQYEMLGRLDDFFDRYGNLVRPFVGIISQSDFEKYAKSAPDEIAQIYYFPLSDLPKIAPSPTLEQLTKRHPTYSYTENGTFIWGLTARILMHLGKVLQLTQ